MDKFEEEINRIMLEEESRVIKTRKFYPRKIKSVGGFSEDFIKSFKEEIFRLKSLDENITEQHIFKALDFEIKK